MKPRMLITGGYGFVGSALLRDARKTFNLCLITRTKKKPEDIVWDMTGKPPDLPDAQYIVHLASATAKAANDTTTLADYRRQNVETTNAFFSALVTKPTYVLYVSTADVYAKHRTPYAISKLEAEAIATSYCRDHNIPLGIARLGLIYGPGEGVYQKAIPMFMVVPKLNWLSMLNNRFEAN